MILMLYIIIVVLAFKDLTVIKDWDYIKPIYNDDDDNRKYSTVRCKLF